MNDDEKAARTFNEDQQGMFGAEEANQAGSPVRPREPDVPAPLDVSFEPPPVREPTDPADEPRLHVVATRGEGGTDITGGTDKYGPGGLADSENPESGETGARETGDIAGASSTHAGAGGDTGQTGGTGTAPNTVGGLGQE
jgi:hypothetical protein